MASEVATTGPSEKELAKLYESMTPATRAVVDARRTSSTKRAVGTVLMAYNDGLMVRDMMDPKKESTYGTGAVAQMAAYFGETTATLYGLKNFVDKFDKDYVQEWTDRPMPYQKHLTLSHWLAVTQLDKVADAEKLLKRAIKEGLSANQVEAEVRSGAMTRKNARSGGRPHSRPASPMAGLQKLGSLALGLLNYGKACTESMFSNIDELAPADVSSTLLDKLTATRDQIDKTETELGDLKEYLAKNIVRVETVLEEKEKAEAEAKEAKDAEDAEEAARATSPKMKTKPAAAANGKPVTNGKPVATNGKPTGDKKKKKKAGKPVAAV